MKVLLVNTFDRGGAGKACIRLHFGLRNLGIASSLLFRAASGHVDNSVSIKTNIAQHNKIDKFRSRAANLLSKKLLSSLSSKHSETRFLENRLPGLELFTFPNSNFDITRVTSYKEADLINLHWVANFLDYKSFFIKNKKPVVWTLHDMNPFSGGEHYEEEYLGIDENGFPLSREISTLERSLFNKHLKIKKEAIASSNTMHIVVLCRWMADQVRNSDIFSGFPIHIIPNGIDSNIFRPTDMGMSRENFNLAQDKKIILFVADAIEKHRKGFNYLVKAIEQITDENVLLCSVGHQGVAMANNARYVHLGVINNEETMRKIYAAANVFVIPSLMDNLPNTVIESLLCGTPVIGFPVGGIPDMIQHGINGILAKEVSVAALKESILDYLRGAYTFDSVHIRKNAILKYDSKIQAKAYEELFRSILKI